MSAPEFPTPQSEEGLDLLVIGVAIGDGDVGDDASDHPDVAAPSTPSDGLDLWLAIVRNGVIILYTGKMELGSGGRTIFTQFVTEYFVNEVASAAGIDSLDFRLTNTPDARDLDLLATTVRLSACESRKAPKKAHTKASALIGCGIAMTRYGANDVRSALVIDVEIEPMTGKVTLTRARSAFECSWIGNIKDLADQIESALVRGLSGASRRQDWFDGRNVTRPYWNDARILTLAELPPVQMHLIPRPDRPWGALADGGTIATAVALANAVLDAAGEHCGHIVPNPDSVTAIM